MITTDTIIIVITLVIWFFWIGYIQYNYDNEAEQLREYMKQTNDILDKRIEVLNEAINTARTGKRTTGESEND